MLPELQGQQQLVPQGCPRILMQKVCMVVEGSVMEGSVTEGSVVEGSVGQTLGLFTIDRGEYRNRRKGSKLTSGECAHALGHDLGKNWLCLSEAQSDQPKFTDHHG